MNDRSIPRKMTLGAAGVAAVSLCDKCMACVVCITIITIVGILVQGWIDAKTNPNK